MKRRIKKILGPRTASALHLGVVSMAVGLRRAARRVIQGGRQSTAPVATFSDSDYHIFFGYYDLNPFDREERRLLCIRLPVNGHPNSGTSAQVGFFQLDRPEHPFIQIGETETWCWQQGCRLQWYPATSSRSIIYNSMVDGRYGCVVQNIETGEIEGAYPLPIYTLSRDGRWGLSVNFSRLERLRPGYGYLNLPDETASDPMPNDDGVWKIDLQTGAIKRLFSIAEIARMANSRSIDASAEHYFNHLLINPSGTRFLFFHLQAGQGESRSIRMLTADMDGSDLRILNDSGFISHYNWKSDKEVLAFAEGERGKRYYLYNDETGAAEVVGEHDLIEDGHPSFGPGGMVFVADTYPDKYRDQHLFLYGLEQQRAVPIAKLYSPPRFRGVLRCDLHPRISASGRLVCVDRILNGRRAVSVFDVGRVHDYLLARTVIGDVDAAVVRN